MAKTKPPLGIKPRAIHDRERACAILHAMIRYSAAGKTVPSIWRDEVRDLFGTLVGSD